VGGEEGGEEGVGLDFGAGGVEEGGGEDVEALEVDGGGGGGCYCCCRGGGGG